MGETTFVGVGVPLLLLLSGEFTPFKGLTGATMALVLLGLIPFGILDLLENSFPGCCTNNSLLLY